MDALNDAMLNNNTASTFGASRSDSAPMRAFLQQSPGAQFEATTIAPSWLEPQRVRKPVTPYTPGESMTQGGQHYIPETFTITTPHKNRKMLNVFFYYDICRQFICKQSLVI